MARRLEFALMMQDDKSGWVEKIPEDVAYITAGVDPGSDRIEITFLGHSPDFRYVLGHHIVYHKGCAVMVDLSTLPSPAVIEELSFEAIVDRQKAKFQELWEAVRIGNPDLDLPAYDVAMLETDPVVVLIEVESYRELLLRARANDVARSNLLSFSIGADLEHLAADHGVTKLTGETDLALRQRIVLADQGNSAAGSEEWYEFHARSASVEVADVAVYRKGSGPEIELAVLSTAADGVASEDLLLAVRTRPSYSARFRPG